MALMLGKLYDALIGAGASSEQAREAAEEVARYEERLNRIEPDLSVLKWMVGAVMAVVLGVFWMQWQLAADMAEIKAQLSGGDARASAASAVEIPPP